VRYSGKLATRTGDTVEAVFSIYAAPEGGEPLWTETQKLRLTWEGSYTVLLGSVSQTGVPQTLFAAARRAGWASQWSGLRSWSGCCFRAFPTHEVGRLPGAGRTSGRGFRDPGTIIGAILPVFGATHLDAGDGVPAVDLRHHHGLGHRGSIPEFTGANTIGNSEMVQVGTDIGINEPTPVATLDVNGTANVRGTLSFLRWPRRPPPLDSTRK